MAAKSSLSTLNKLVAALEHQAKVATSTSAYLQEAAQAVCQQWPQIAGFEVSTWQRNRTPLRISTNNSTSIEQWIVPLLPTENGDSLAIIFQVSSPDDDLWKTVQLWGQAVQQTWQVLHPPSPKRTTTKQGPEAEPNDNLIALLHTLGQLPPTRERMTEALRLVVEAYGFIDHVSILIADNAPASGTLVAEYPDHAVVGQTVPLTGNRIHEQLLTTHSPVVISNLATTELLEPSNREQLRRLGIQTLLVLPLVVDGVVLGSLGVDVFYASREFSDDEVESLAIIAAYLANTLQNQRLKTELRQRSGSQEVVNDLLETLPLRSDVATLLHTTGMALGKLLGASRVHICLATEPVEVTDEA
ncbi:MAG: GAF domain-containing protein [Chloroflexi bacterium]|nr:GAF domain-containing protein [Chloroflexota bacterium]